METKKKAVVFIDGNNLYHNLKSIYVKPGNLDLSKFINYICDHFKCSLQKVIYYNSKPDIREGKSKYYKHLSYMSKIGKIPKFKVKLRKLQTHSTWELKKESKKIIENLDLCASCSPIIKKFLEDKIGRVKMKEKGVDVLIVVDMIRLALIDNQEICCILVSGDADFIPALEILKEKGKDIFSASVTGGYSRNLRQKFPYFIVNRRNIMEHCLEKNN